MEPNFLLLTTRLLTIPSARTIDNSLVCKGRSGSHWRTCGQSNTLFHEGEGIWGISTAPAFGIGQRALLIRSGKGNILWDCLSLIDSDTVALIKALGGIHAIAISHPHYYTSMVEWRQAFGAFLFTYSMMIASGCSVPMPA